MTDRHIGYIVVLEEAIREDDAEETVINAIKMVRGVLSVEPIINDVDKQMAYVKAKEELKTRLWNALWGAKGECPLG